MYLLIDSGLVNKSPIKKGEKLLMIHEAQLWNRAQGNG